MTRSHFPILIALLLSAGCSSRPVFVAPELPDAFPNHERRFIVDAVDASGNGFESLETRSRMRFETPHESRSVNLELTYRRADSLLAKAKVALGIEAMRALVTPDSFFVYDRIGKRLYLGSVDQAYRLLPIPGEIDEMFDNWTGTVPVDRRIDWQVSNDSLYYYLSTNDGTKSITVDPRLWRVVRQEERTSSGALIERRTFTDFDSFGEYVVPRRIDVERPQAGERFQVYHRSVHVNPERLSFRFEVGTVNEEIVVSDAD